MSVLGLAAYLLAAGLTFEIFMTGYGWRRKSPRWADPGEEYLAAFLLSVLCPVVLTLLVVTGVGRLLVSNFMGND